MAFGSSISAVWSPTGLPPHCARAVRLQWDISHPQPKAGGSKVANLRQICCSQELKCFPWEGPTPLGPLHAGTAVSSQQSVRWGRTRLHLCHSLLPESCISICLLPVIGSCSGASAGGQGVTSGLPHPCTAFHCAPSSQAHHQHLLWKAS